MLLIGLGFLAGAYFSYVDQNTGPEVSATVSSCSGSNGRFSSGVREPGSSVARSSAVRVPIIFLVFGLPALFIGARALLFGAPQSWTPRRTPRQPAV